MTSPEKGADTLVFLAEGMSGVDFPSVKAEPSAPGVLALSTAQRKQRQRLGVWMHQPVMSRRS
jgi:hypothetical protein